MTSERLSNLPKVTQPARQRRPHLEPYFCRFRHPLNHKHRSLHLLACIKNPTMKVPRSELLPLGTFSSLSPLIFDVGSQSFCWSHVSEAGGCCSLHVCLMLWKSGEGMVWQIVLCSVLNECLFTGYTSLHLMCSSLISSHLRAGSQLMYPNLVLSSCNNLFFSPQIRDQNSCSKKMHCIYHGACRVQGKSTAESQRICAGSLTEPEMPPHPGWIFLLHFAPCKSIVQTQNCAPINLLGNS